MHTFIKYLGISVVILLIGVRIFSRMFAERTVWQGKALTIVLGVLSLAFIVYWLFYGEPHLARLWPNM